MPEYAAQVGALQDVLYAEGKQKLLVVIQAMNTGGKDGAIRGVFSEMDAQGVRVASFKRPTANELARDYLWRVHSQVPRNGECVIFNRSHYEDIVAVRVREILPQAVWQKRYDHIAAFEKMLHDEGTTIVKFFLHISPEEQKKRLQARLDSPEKHWKFDPGDLKDRELWPDFMKAYQDVLRKTSTAAAPWYVIPADRKWYRNLAIAQIVIGTMRAMRMKYPPVDFDPKEITIK